MKNLKLTVTEREETAAADEETQSLSLSCTDGTSMSGALVQPESAAQPGPLSPLEP
jgi:hypothetical protein